MRTHCLLGVVFAGALLASASTALFANEESLPQPFYAIQNGDVNGDWGVDLSDPIYLLGFLYRGGPAPAPLAICAGADREVQNGDANGDDLLDLSDGIHLLSWLFSGGHAPADACGSVLDGGGGAAANQNPRVIPIHATPHGLSYGEWSAKWWQWALGIPAASNPLLDSTGEFCDVGQSGPVWFLAGTFGGAATRACTVPPGKALFFPLFDTVWGGPPPAGDCTEDPCNIDRLRDLAAGRVAQVTLLEAEVDGVALKGLASYRALSPVFSVVFPEGNVFELPAGPFEPLISDGYFLMLAPQSVGQHTIHFQAIRTRPNGTTFEVEVTYQLTVAP